MVAPFRVTAHTFHSKNLRRDIITLNLSVFLPRRKVFGEKVCVVTVWQEAMFVEVLSGRKGDIMGCIICGKRVCRRGSRQVINKIMC